MTQEAAERFAQALLKQFAREEEFRFELPPGHNLDIVMAALVKAGCEVEAEGDTRVRVKVQADQTSLA